MGILLTSLHCRVHASAAAAAPQRFQLNKFFVPDITPQDGAHSPAQANSLPPYPIALCLHH